MTATGQPQLTAVLVDDTEDIRLLLRMHLANDGRIGVVGEATNAVQAYDIVVDTHPHLLVLDLAMPNLDGLEILPRLRALRPDLKILVLSGFASRHMADRALRAGADAYLEKGTSFRIITQKMLDLVGIEELEDERTTARAASVLEEASDADRPLDGETLLALIAHELRTPITVLTGLSARLARSAADMDPALVSVASVAVQRNVRRLDRLVSSFSDLYALDRGVLRLDIAPLAVHEFVDGCIRELQTFLDGREVRVATDAIWAEVDAVRLEQVVVNLILNAARYTPARSTIEVGTELEEGMLVLTVRDHGDGVPTRDRERIFRKFSRDPEGGGTGLGLYLSRALVEAHGGTLRYEVPVDGVGACFAVRLPGASDVAPMTVDETPHWG